MKSMMMCLEMSVDTEERIVLGRHPASRKECLPGSGSMDPKPSCWAAAGRFSSYRTGCREAKRAVRDAMPLFASTGGVTVVSVDARSVCRCPRMKIRKSPPI